ncbi:MAG: hypothetical protein O7B81_16050 [Gammaproteobacteria bacterium]|nr:hypothetical protein [Gammaproteobacteria bacterium]
MKLLTVIMILAGIVASAPLEAAEFGRLFLTPAQRAALDRARHAAPVPVVPEVNETAPLADIFIEDESEIYEPITVDGFVSRSSGPSTVWINGTNSFQGDLGDFGIDSQRVQIETGGVRLPIGTSGGSVVLKPGQSFDPGSETISDVYERRGTP